jgi:hypothetical protein
MLVIAGVLFVLVATLVDLKAAAGSWQLQFGVVYRELFRGRNQSPGVAEMERGHDLRLDMAQLGLELDCAFPGWILGTDLCPPVWGWTI